MGLTKAMVERLRYSREPKVVGEKTVYPQQIVWDGTVPGFGIRVYPSEKRSFVLFFRACGRQHMMSLGQYGPLTVDQARARAKQYLAEVIGGANPLAARRDVAMGKTVKELCSVYLARHARVHKKSARDDEGRIARYVLPALGGLKVARVTRADIAKLHLNIGQRAPYEANRVLAMLRKMFGLAKDWGFIDETDANPAQRISLFKEKKRDRWATAEELSAIFDAINLEDNFFIRCALCLYLLTGARKSELLRAKWADVDWLRAELKFTDTKTNRPHQIPLSKGAVELLQQLPKIENNPHIFPGHKKSKPLVNIEKPWNRIRKKAGVIDLRLHDLRRTVGSWLAQSGHSLHLIGRVLNHTNTTTTAVYARFDSEHVRAALDAHGRLMSALMAKSSPACAVDDQEVKNG